MGSTLGERRHDRLRTNSDRRADVADRVTSPSATLHTCLPRRDVRSRRVSSMSQQKNQNKKPTVLMLPAGAPPHEGHPGSRRVLRPGAGPGSTRAGRLHRATSAARRQRPARGKRAWRRLRTIGCRCAVRPAQSRGHAGHCPRVGSDPQHGSLQGQHCSDLVPTLRSGPATNVRRAPPHARAIPRTRPILGDLLLT